jgi:hypothetical protein
MAPGFFMELRPMLINGCYGAIVAVVVGCATTAQTPANANLDNLTKPSNLPGKPGCFWKSNFQGDWTVLNDSTLIVRAPLAKDAYVVKLFEPVFNLSFDQALGFEDKEHTGQICNNGDAYLVLPHWEPPEVPIVAVHALTSLEENQLLAAAGRRVPQHGARPFASTQQ